MFWTDVVQGGVGMVLMYDSRESETCSPSYSLSLSPSLLGGGVDWWQRFASPGGGAPIRRNGHVEMAGQLIEAGASIDLQNTVRRPGRGGRGGPCLFGATGDLGR